MREYERLRTEGKLSELVSGSSVLKDKLVKDDVTTSSAGDVGSESSISDVQVSASIHIGNFHRFLSSSNLMFYADYSSLFHSTQGLTLKPWTILSSLLCR